MRYTTKDARISFQRWLRAIGGHEATSYNDVGGYMLDYNPTYGGVQIECVVTEGGGIRLIGTRMTPQDFHYAVNFALDTKGEEAT